MFYNAIRIKEWAECTVRKMTSFYLFELYSEVYNLFISSSNYVIYCSQPSVNKKSFCLASIIVQSLSRVWFFATPWTAGRQAYLSFTISQNLLKLMSIESVMPFNHLILCYPLLLPSIFPSIRCFPDESALCIRWPKYWSFSFSISPSNVYSGLISFKIDWFDLLAVQGTLKNLLLEVYIFTHKFNIQSCTIRNVTFNFQD